MAARIAYTKTWHVVVVVGRFLRSLRPTQCLPLPRTTAPTSAMSVRRSLSTSTAFPILSPTLWPSSPTSSSLDTQVFLQTHTYTHPPPHPPMPSGKKKCILVACMCAQSNVPCGSDVAMFGAPSSGLSHPVPCLLSPTTLTWGDLAVCVFDEKKFGGGGCRGYFSRTRYRGKGKADLLFSEEF